MALNMMVLIMFDKDLLIYPAESELFGTLQSKKADGTNAVLKLEDTEMYKQDWLGLRYLVEHG